MAYLSVPWGFRVSFLSASPLDNYSMSWRHALVKGYVASPHSEHIREENMNLKVILDKLEDNRDNIIIIGEHTLKKIVNLGKLKNVRHFYYIIKNGLCQVVSLKK